MFAGTKTTLTPDFQWQRLMPAFLKVSHGTRNVSPDAPSSPELFNFVKASRVRAWSLTVSPAIFDESRGASSYSYRLISHTVLFFSLILSIPAESYLGAFVVEYLASQSLLDSKPSPVCTLITMLKSNTSIVSCVVSHRLVIISRSLL